MGGYGGYVWSAFGFALLSMGGLLWLSWRAQARRGEELRQLRSTLRGGGEEQSGRRPRRLVATEPETGPETGHQPDAEPGSGSRRLATTGSTTGT